MIYTQRMTSIMMTTMINIGRRCNNDIDGGVDVSGTKIQHNRKISWRHHIDTSIDRAGRRQSRPWRAQNCNRK